MKKIFSGTAEVISDALWVVGLVIFVARALPGLWRQERRIKEMARNGFRDQPR